ncbi:MAG: transglutaminase family protein [Rhizobiaceae bacterium]
MQLKISHTSTYHYDQPVPYALQRLRLTPLSNACQTVHGWTVNCHGAAKEVSFRDGFGNVCDLIRHERNAFEISITAEGTVTTHGTAGVFGEDGGQSPLWMYGRQSMLTLPGNAIVDLANHVTAIAGPLEQLHALMQEVTVRMRYEAGWTDVETEAETALAAGHGVCQDLAHVFCAASRLNGIPARYVSGYLMMDGVEQQAASHAWAEAHVPGLGWVGFDPANNISPNEKYVRIAIGLDYRDAAPISGIRFGDAGEKLEVSVKVEQ